MFPAIRNCGPETVGVAPGTSCRLQILAGTERQALHPVPVMHQTLVEALPYRRSSLGHCGGRDGAEGGGLTLRRGGEKTGRQRADDTI